MDFTTALILLPMGALATWIGVQLLRRPYRFDRSPFAWFIVGFGDSARYSLVRRRAREAEFLVMGGTLVVTTTFMIAT